MKYFVFYFRKTVCSGSCRRSMIKFLLTYGGVHIMSIPQRFVFFRAIPAHLSPCLLYKLLFRSKPFFLQRKFLLFRNPFDQSFFFQNLRFVEWRWCLPPPFPLTPFIFFFQEPFFCRKKSLLFLFYLYGKYLFFKKAPHKSQKIYIPQSFFLWKEKWFIIKKRKIPTGTF